MSWFEGTVAERAALMLLQRGVPYRLVHLEDAVRRVCRRKGAPSSADVLARIVAERLVTSHRRLSHGTGATGWS